MSEPKFSVGEVVIFLMIPRAGVETQLVTVAAVHPEPRIAWQACGVCHSTTLPAYAIDTTFGLPSEYVENMWCECNLRKRPDEGAGFADLMARYRQEVMA